MVNSIGLAIAAAALFAFPGHCDLYPKSSAVLSVDNKSYDRLITQSNHTSIVEFYAPWCGHCKNLQPIYENAAKKLKGLVKVAAVNCDKESNKPLCARFGVKGFPTLNIILPGKTSGKPTVEEYQGPRTVKGIYDTVIEKIPNNVKVLKEETITEWIQDSINTPKAILFTDKLKVSPLYKALAIDFNGNIQFGQFQTTLDAKTFNEDYDIKKLPKLLLVKDGQKIYHEGEMKKENLVEFLSQVAPPHPDPAPVSIKLPKSDNDRNASKTKESTTDSKPKDQKPILAPVVATPLPSLSNEIESANLCLSSKTGTCVLALTANTQDKSTEALVDSLSMLISKYNKQKRVIFPVYLLPESNPKYAVLRTELSLEGEVNIIAINGKRGWWKQSPGFDLASPTTFESTLESWISEIQLGEGEKKKLPSRLISEEAERDLDEKVESTPGAEDEPEENKPIEKVKSEDVEPEEAENSIEEKAEATLTEENKPEEVEEPVKLETQATEDAEPEVKKPTESAPDAKSTAKSDSETGGEDKHDEL
ncbi:hypothetical protein K3495_g2762 [Podosphaera aphanis]|nr:hypothetical protein K3495_g2762 [Podosphaera aphanis]